MTIAMETVSVSDDGLRAALADAALPADDLENAGCRFFRFTADERAVGYGGIENYGKAALLRSVVVLPDCRGKGVGEEMTLLLLSHARRSGIRALYLLTTSAAAFFARNGFRRIERAEAPPEIIGTRQAASLCPASATLMKLELDDAGAT